MTTPKIPADPASRRAFLGGAGCMAALAGGAAGFSATADAALHNVVIGLPNEVNVRMAGGGGPSAVGDGVADDTDAIAEILARLLEAGGGRLYFPPGRYRLTRPLVIDKTVRLDIAGAGHSSLLLRDHPGHLLVWAEDTPCRECTVRGLHFASMCAETPPESAEIACLGGAERSLFCDLLFRAGEGGVMGSGVLLRKVADTTSLSHCVLWGVTGTGLEIGEGSEVRVLGGRIIGFNRRTAPHPAVGILLTGNNGGVHVITTDIIGLHTAMQIGVPGGKSNREIFITHATIDSCVHGLVQKDNAYTSIAGCWAASCDEEQILVEESARGAILAITGGTIFNGGAYNEPGTANGMVVRAGSFVLSGVTVRHNKGTGLLIGDKVRDYAVTGCRIADNGVGVRLGGDRFTFTGNVLSRNGEQLVDEAGPRRGLTGNMLGEPEKG
ncbi:MAG: hypothetical protein GX580_11900 [Candidatus Hydrogenedens sp.]|nr:hypothetical protein [Candidatus Hydrogenedentota bacterium]NLF58329.1 hypothetical protein [Candidatus Hydrogenedens sp.]